MKNTRSALAGTLLIGSLICFVAVMRLGAASPASGTITPSSAPVTWRGTAAGGAYNGESTCIDGVNCDVFTLTISGTPADWVEFPCW